MRNCPVCGSDERQMIDPDYSYDFDLFSCECGMYYLDAVWMTQAWLDNYYLTEYMTDDKPYSDDRLASLAKYIQSFEPRNVLDIGGMDGELQSRLNDLDVLCDITGVKNDNQKKYDIVVLSHTLEHIYDVPSMFSRILGNLGNRLIIEVPIWYDYQNLGYDLHWQHINKFTKHHLEELLLNYGFQISASESILDYREYHCHRVMAWVL